MARSLYRTARQDWPARRRPNHSSATPTTSTTYSKILDAATPGDTDKPAKATTIGYREALARLWLLDPIPGWIPEGHLLTRLAQAPKHHLADPALAARLLGATATGLLRNTVGSGLTPADGVLLGALFESLVTLSVRVYAQPLDATVHHLRTQNGDHEVDLVVEGADRRVVALEVKLAADVTTKDVRHLTWLRYLDRRQPLELSKAHIDGCRTRG